MTTVEIAGLTVYEIIWFFLIYSFLGWVLEVVYHGVSKGVIVNRGFLNGPVCPIYGFGMVGVFSLFNSLSPGGAAELNAGLMFIFGTALATAIELFGGWILNKLFHTRWWDYSKEAYNFKGYICPKFSLYWGLIIVFAVKLFHPFIAKITVEFWPEKYAWPVAIGFSAVMIIDVVITVLTVNGFNKELASLDEVQKSMRSVSDKLTEVLGTSSIEAAKRVKEDREKAELAGRELKEKVSGLHEKHIEELNRKKEALKERHRRILEKLSGSGLFGPKRLIKAFPDMRVKDHKEAFETLKDEIEK